MARFARLDTLNTMLEAGLVPLFYEKNPETAMKIVDALAAGGARILEFTNRGDYAFPVFSQLLPYCAQKHPQLIVGVGSVVDAPTAALYITHGANFVVGPSTVPEIATLCNRRKIPYIPGCGSVTEISQAEELGVEIVKVFPGDSVGGPGFIKAVLGPCPWTRVMPTGGVNATPENIEAWIKAGAACVGMGSNLIVKKYVEGENWESISELVTTVLQYIRDARGTPLFLGVEHVGLYPQAGVDAGQIAAWYQSRFGFKVSEGNSSYFAAGTGSGRIELWKENTGDRAHVAIRVSNFEKAVELLRNSGAELEEPKIKPGLKSVFLKEKDPAGYAVHLLWTR